MQQRGQVFEKDDAVPEKDSFPPLYRNESNYCYKSVMCGEKSWMCQVWKCDYMQSTKRKKTNKKTMVHSQTMVTVIVGRLLGH